MLYTWKSFFPSLLFEGGHFSFFIISSLLMQRPGSLASQFKNWENRITSTPVPSAEQQVWNLSKSRSGFLKPPIIPVLPAIPISDKAAALKLAFRRSEFDRSAPAAFAPGLQKILARASGRSKKTCLLSLLHLRLDHLRGFTSLSKKLPPLSKEERSVV